jgi:nitrite reductase/ring-hydroxylating ferredoxin subunit
MEHDACALADIADLGKKTVSVGGQKVLLLRKGDEVWGVAPKCPHMKLPLSVGKWDGETLKCLFHGSCYKIADGSRVKAAWLLGSMGSDKLATYPVTVKDGRVHVET